MRDHFFSQLRPYWYIAAEARELGTKPLTRTILGERLVLFRDGEGRPAALIDRCAHRNMALSRGRVSRGAIECPYHGWRYRGDGRCVAIPSSSSSVPPEEIALRCYPTAQSDGFVWVYMALNPHTSPPHFPHLGEAGWTSFTMRTHFSAGAFACLENFLDCPHTVYVHRGWFRSPHTQEARAEIARGDDWVEARFSEERDAKSVVSRLLFPSGRKMIHTDRFLMPATSRVDYVFGPDRHFIITSQCTPVSEHETEVYTVITFRFGRIGPFVRLFFEPLSRRIIRQDVEILRLQTEQLKHFGGEHFTFIESDLIGPDIRRLWRQALGSQDNQRKTNHPSETRNVVLRF